MLTRDRPSGFAMPGDINYRKIVVHDATVSQSYAAPVGRRLRTGSVRPERSEPAMLARFSTSGLESQELFRNQCSRPQSEPRLMSAQDQASRIAPPLSCLSVMLPRKMPI